jgi:hypothetical protein
MIRAARTPLTLIGGLFAMRTLVIAACVLVVSFSSLQARADSCKPDVSRVDKITKQQQDIWVQKVGGTGFGASLMGSTDMAVSITVGRYGTFSAVNVEILKEEASAASASFASSLHAAKGSRFFLGLKEGGEPLAFVATDVANSTTVRNDVLDFGHGKVVTSIVLSSAMTDHALAGMREALTKKPIDAIRIILVGDLRVEYSMEEKTSKKLMSKFQCFFEAMDKRGVGRQPASDPARVAAVRGRYVKRGKPSDIEELNADGTWGERSDGHTMRGTYTIQGDTITYAFADMPLLTAKSQVAGDTIKEKDGSIWEKLPEAQQATAPPIPDEPPPSKEVLASAVGRFVLKGGTKYFDLKADGTLECLLNVPCSGTYKLVGGGIYLEFNGLPAFMHLVGNTLGGGSEVWEKRVADAPKAAAATVTLRLGMTPEQVEAAQGGKPQKVIDLGSKKTYVYPDMKIIFVDGKVTDIQ